MAKKASIPRKINYCEMIITINGVNISKQRNFQQKLTLERVIGDVADNFTLVLYDKTAFQVEQELLLGYNNTFPTIQIQYCNRDGSYWKQFSGFVYNYKTNFVGLGVAVTLEGVVSAYGNGSLSNKSVDLLGALGKMSMTWVRQPVDGDYIKGTLNGNEVMQYDYNTALRNLSSEYKYYVKDSDDIIMLPPEKNVAEGSWSIDNDCLVMDWQGAVKPSDIFKRVIYTLKNWSKYGISTYSFDKEGNLKVSTKKKKFPLTFDYDIGKVDDTLPIKCTEIFVQEEETIMNYLNRLCKYAVYNNSKNNTSKSGFKVVVNGNKISFVALDYTTEKSSSVEYVYGGENSQVISISMETSGALALAGANPSLGDVIQTNGALDDITADFTTDDISGYDDTKFSLPIVFSSYAGFTATSDYISSMNVDDQKKLTESRWMSMYDTNVYKGTIQLYGDTKDEYAPGNYIDLSIKILGKGVSGLGGLHYYSGKYYITKVEDNIVNGVYTTSLSVVKNTNSVKSTAYTVSTETPSTNVVKDKSKTPLLDASVHYSFYDAEIAVGMIENQGSTKGYTQEDLIGIMHAIYLHKSDIDADGIKVIRGYIDNDLWLRFEEELVVNLVDGAWAGISSILKSHKGLSNVLVCDVIYKTVLFKYDKEALPILRLVKDKEGMTDLIYKSLYAYIESGTPFPENTGGMTPGAGGRRRPEEAGGGF